MKRNVGQNLRINKWYIFMMLPENELPLFERPAAATGVYRDKHSLRPNVYAIHPESYVILVIFNTM